MPGAAVESLAFHTRTAVPVNLQVSDGGRAAPLCVGRTVRFPSVGESTAASLRDFDAELMCVPGTPGPAPAILPV